MNNVLGTLTVATVLLFAVSAMAQTKVVVIPLNGKKDTGAAVARTGQTPTVPITAPAGSDGALQKGATWPSPRFTDNGDGTVTDNLTELVWLKNANCFGARDWATALNDSNGLADAACGLSDGSAAGNWRLPNEKELHSLIDLAYAIPSLSNDAGTGQWTSGGGSAFSGVQADGYWSSSTSAGNTANAWQVSLITGHVNHTSKSSIFYYVWPVRD